MKVFSTLFIVGMLLFRAENKMNEISSSTTMAMNKVSCKNLQSNEEIVFTYEDILFNYYAEALEYKTIHGDDFVSYDEFASVYYENNLDIQTYTDGWKYVDTKDYVGYDYAENIPMLTSSGDADYIIGDQTYSITPASAFNRRPDYKNRNFYSNVQLGDIVYETKTKFFDTGHTALVTDLSKEIEGDNRSYIETIEAVGGGVQYGYLDDDRFIRYCVKILRVRDSYYTRDKAIEFMKLQLGKKYSLDITRANTDINSTEWYCSELVWAAYYYAGVDIYTYNHIPQGFPGNEGGITPHGLYVADFTSELSFGTYFINMSILSKERKVWTIRLLNSAYSSKNMQYNSRMCFSDACVNWENLKDLKDITIPGHGYVDVKISENLFATSIVCGWKTIIIDENNKRKEIHYITYADELDSDTKTMNIQYAIL